MLPPELQQLADDCGVLTSYEDVHKQRCQASVDSLLAVFNALGVDVNSLDDVPRTLATRQLSRCQRGIEPVLVVWDGLATEFLLTLPESDAKATITCSISLEGQQETISRQHQLDEISPQGSPCSGFVTYQIPLPSGLEPGYHELRVATANKTYESLIVSAPSHAYIHPDQSRRDWGCFLPLYALRSQRNWGAGDFRDLQNVAEWTEKLGGRVVGTLPMLAAYLDEPYEPSPYAPASRLAWNEFYIDVTGVAELTQTPAAVDLMQSADFRDQVDSLRQSKLVPYRELMALKRSILDMLSTRFFEKNNSERRASFERFLQNHPHIRDYARFRSACELRGETWHDWPTAMRDGALAASDVDGRAERYHLYVQWIAHEQLRSLAETNEGGLYLDLPLGVRPDGYDVWRWRRSYAIDASAGSPPDAVWTKGQNWCFPPLHPESIREGGYGHVRDYLRHHLRLARMLRVDHVMQLHRLYWIPRGLPADQGVYVQYRPDEFYALLTLESHRCQTTLVGENLGTVPPQVNKAMDRHGLARMYVVQYEVADEVDDSPPVPRSTNRKDSAGADAMSNAAAALSDVPPGAMSSLNTHDMPPYAAWWRGEDIALRQQLGLITESSAMQERKRLAAKKIQLTAWLRREGWLTEADADDDAALRAILRFLSASPAGVVLVNLEDLWLESQPQNVPGTGPELPNWKRKAKLTLEDFMEADEVVSALSMVDQLRRKSASKAG